MIKPKKRRFRHPSMKDGDLKVWWGRVERGEEPSLVYSWQGDRSMKRDTVIVMNALEGGILDRENGMVKELERRGYDITTLKLSISKKEPYTPPV